ncbi:MAG: ion channel protein [Herbiconiux sp.]|nr:ion channel protein [Herbiconiux sp.]
MTVPPGGASAGAGAAAASPAAPSVRLQLILAVPAVLIGVVSALVLFALDELAGGLEHVLWAVLPGTLGVDPDSGWWIFGVLTVTGIAVGLVVWLVPGHGGRDSATSDMIAPPMPAYMLPSLALAAVLGLAGGVSLGPENPIIAINSGLLVVVVARFWKRIPLELIVMCAAAGTVGALFGTPIAAALVLTGVVAARPGPGELWDRLFLPLVAAGAGSITMTLLAHPTFGLTLPAYDAIAPLDVLWAALVASVAAAAGVVCVVLFRLLHRQFHAIGHPLLYIGLGGVVLGVLGAIGGPLTLFKGLEQMGELIGDRAEYDGWQLFSFFGIKLLALAVAGAAGFRGGHIFPAVFLGAAFGLLVNALVPGIPVTVAVSAGVLGLVLAISRDGWIALFVAVVVSSNLVVLPLMCLAVLPAWLVVTKAPPMVIAVPRPAVPAP